MISCIEFIPAYSEAFKFLEEKGGKEKVRDFWKYLSDNYLSDSLKDLVIEKGLLGCYEYWSKSLNEEAADFTMTLDKENSIFTVEMHKCPSKSMLLDLVYMQPYESYCEHCDLLYRRVLEPLGYEYSYDFSECDNAKCKLTVKKTGI